MKLRSSGTVLKNSSRYHVMYAQSAASGSKMKPNCVQVR
jgi:hypothetical protein